MISRIVRAPLSLIPQETKVIIFRGPVRGKRWIKGAGPNTYWLGRYEAARTQEFADAIVPGAVVYDIGANVGMYTLIASARVGITGCVYAFEPSERNLCYLRRHITMNNLQNCTVVPKAVCNEVGTRRFAAASRDSSMARISMDGELVVPATTLDECVYSSTRFRPPNVLKIDVEGAELEVLQGAEQTLTQFHPTILVEIHGTQLHVDCRSFLVAKGYKVKEAYGQLTAE